MKIDPSKKYTCKGHPVEFLHRRPEGWPGEYQWVGLANGVQQTWTDEGLHYKKYPISDFNLVEVREPMRMKIWVRGNDRPWRDCDVDAHAMFRDGWTFKEFVEVMP
jgi:hypothetical protein